MIFNMSWIYLLMLILTSVCCDPSGFKDLVWGMRLKNYLIEVVTKGSILDCVENCMSRKRCLSINHQRRNLWCELNYIESQTDVNILDADQTFVFTSMKSWNKVIAGACSPQPCRENEKCIPTSFANHKCEISDCGPVITKEEVTEVINHAEFVKIGVGARRHFKCKEGFDPVNQTGSTYCSANGEWTALSIKCVVSCVTGWKQDTDQGHSYCFSEDWKTWDDAKDACQTMDSQLAIITSWNMDKFFQNYFNHQSIPDSVYSGYYIGASDESKQGRWIWIDGSEVQYKNWGPGEPNGGGEEPCMVYRRYSFSGWKWNDATCYYKKKYICQKLSAHSNA